MSITASSMSPAFELQAGQPMLWIPRGRIRRPFLPPYHPTILQPHLGLLRSDLEELLKMRTREVWSPVVGVLIPWDRIANDVDGVSTTKKMTVVI